MAKICKQCGVKYKNSATKCVMCGTEFEDTHIYEKKKKGIIFGIIGTLLVAAAIALIILSTGPKAAVWRIMNNYKRNNPDAIVATFPDFLMESENFNSEAFITDIKNEAKQLSNYILAFNMEKAEDPSSKECEEYIELFRYYAGDDFDTNDIKDIKIVWVNYTGNIPSVYPSHATRFIMIKYDGQWCWWPSNVGR